jgi:hypothetical protein
MPNFSRGKYVPKNPEKYVGNRNPTWRSSWELSFMVFLDTNTSVMQWASESISIPYRNPVTGKQSIYVPDFLITYRDKTNQLKAELVEIKPAGQSVITENMKSRDRAVVAVNYAKWAAAQSFCKRQGLLFRVITEKDMFR